jgi:hypothetical protein
MMYGRQLQAAANKSAQLAFLGLGVVDPPQNGRSSGMHLNFKNGVSLASIGLLFRHHWKVFDHPLTDIDKNNEIQTVKQMADKDRDTLNDFQEQPDVSFSMLADDPDNILMTKNQGQNLTYYLFAVL